MTRKDHGKPDWKAQARKRFGELGGFKGANGTNGNGKREPEEDIVIETTPWPAPPAPQAFHGLAGEAVRMIQPETEADSAALLVQFLTCFGSAAGRNIYRAVGPDRHYPNLFTVLVGRTSKGRKGTSLSWIGRLFEQVDPEWHKNCAQTGLSSGEGLIYAVRDEHRSRRPGKDGGGDDLITPGVDDKRCLVIEEEFASPLRLAQREGNILSTVIRQAWDGKRLGTMTRNNPLRATGAHVSIIGHGTRDELVRCLSQQDRSNGFANRFLWICSRRSQLLPDGGRAIDLSPVLTPLEIALRFAKNEGPLERSREAGKMWHRVYPTLSEERPGPLGQVTSRAEAQVLRLAVLYAIIDRTDTIEAPHLRAALALWDYSVRSCKWIFGDTTGNADADLLLDTIKAAGKDGMSNSEVSALFSRNRAATDIRKTLAMLVDFGLVRSEERRKSIGRPAQVWIATTYELNERNERNGGARTYGENGT